MTRYIGLAEYFWLAGQPGAAAPPGRPTSLSFTAMLDSAGPE